MLLDKIAIGNSLKSIEFTEKENASLIRNTPLSPRIFEKEKAIWHKKLFHLGLAGRDIYHSDISAIRITDDLIKVNCQGMNYKYEFNECHIFDYENLIIEHNTDTYSVIDWFEIRQGADFSDVDSIKIDDSFIEEIIFYESNRVDHNPNFKDLVVKSKISKDLINDFECCLTMVKFYCEQYLSDEYAQLIKLESIKREKRFSSKPKYKSSKKIKFYD